MISLPLRSRSTVAANNLVYKLGCSNRVDECKVVFDSTLNRNVYSWTILLSAAFAQNGHLLQARFIFDRMPARNLVSWNSLIVAYARHNHSHDALILFRNLLLLGEPPDNLTFAAAIDSCTDFDQGRDLHSLAAESGSDSCAVFGNTLINMYSRCGSLIDAWSVFLAMEEPDVISWTSMISAFARGGEIQSSLDLFEQMPERNSVSWAAIIAAAAQNDRRDEALSLFRRMDLEGLKLDKIIVLTILQICDSPRKCAEIHSAILLELQGSDVKIFNAILAAYGRCQDLENALELFKEGIPQRDLITWNSLCTAFIQNDEVESSRLQFNRMPKWDLVSWNLMLSAYAQKGLSENSMQLFQEMIWEGFKPDEITLRSLINSCSSPGELEWIQSFLQASEFCNDPRVVGSMINGYRRFGSIECARSTFERVKDLRSDSEAWSQMIACLAQNREAQEAVLLFRMMDLEGVEVTELAFLGMVSACSESATLKDGVEIHRCLEELKLMNKSPVLKNALMDMYRKCGSSELAASIFNSDTDHLENDVISRTALIGSSRGRFPELFQEMLVDGIQPSGVTFLEILSAHAHLGQVNPAIEFFTMMMPDHGIHPMIDHYACIIDLLGRSGEIEAAEELLDSMPFEPALSTWVEIASVCQIHGDSQRGSTAARAAAGLNSEVGRSSPYILLSNQMRQEP